jgi:hypothetical protein
MSVGHPANEALVLAIMDERNAARAASRLPPS